jgi:uncharacterized membrane protein
MNSLPVWVWGIIAAGVLLSPAFALLIAILVEIVFDVVTESGAPALFVFIGICVIARWLLHNRRVRQEAGSLVENRA